MSLCPILLRKHGYWPWELAVFPAAHRPVDYSRLREAVGRQDFSSACDEFTAVGQDMFGLGLHSSQKSCL
jgi:hypothetical protein